MRASTLTAKRSWALACSTTVVVEGQAVTNGAYMYDVTPFQQRRAATASESLDVLVARVIWPSSSELHATLSSPVAIPMRK